MDENISEEVENMQICFYDDLMGSYFIRRQLTDKKVQKYFDFNNFQYKLDYNQLFNDWFLDTLFYGNKSKINKE